METFWHYFGILNWIVSIVMVLVVLGQRRPTATTLAWLVVVYLLPIIGAVFFFLLSGHRLGRKRVKLHRQILQAMRTEDWRGRQRSYANRPNIDAVHQPIVTQAERTSGMPIVGGNDVDFMPSNKAMVDRLIADIDAAKHHAHLLYYIYEPDETGHRVGDALVKAEKRGVKCRLLADAAGSRPFLKRGGLADTLRRQGVEVHAMLPVAPLRRGLARVDLRNHRKLAVLDGTVAYTGSQNIVDDDYGHYAAGCWVDMSGRFTGPVVAQLQTVFLEDWAFETDEVLSVPEVLTIPKPTGDIWCQAVPTGPSHETESFHRVALAALNTAQKRVIITSPYLVPDEPTMLALAMAADRGVEVSIVVPRRSDHWLVSAVGRSFYPALLNAGIRVYHYKGGILHAKTMTVDESFALVGSANLDIRSFYLCFELNVLLYGAAITSELRRLQECYIADSLPIDVGKWKKRAFYKNYVENAASLLAPLL